MLRKLFNLYPGEGRTATLFLILGFLWSLGAFGALTLSEGMFLEHVGAAKLPLSYLLTATCMCALSTLLLFALNRLSIKHLLTSVILGATLLILTLFFLLNFVYVTGQPSWLWYFFKMVGWIIPIAIYICFWAFIDQYYDLQDAKRCFCLFNSVLYLGDAFAGGLISFSLNFFGIGGILLIFAFAMASTIPLIYSVTKKIKVVHEISVERKPLLTTLVPLIVKSPFTLILMLFYFLMQLIVITTEFSYMDAFEKHFTDHRLTEFLGMLAMWVSLGNMFFGIFFYGRTVTRFGVNNLILVAPLFFLTLFSCWVPKEAFIMALFAFIAREGMIYTFDDNNLLLLISGVPTKIKNQVRIAIESFFEPIGMIVGASLLLLFQNQSKELGLALCFIVAVVVLFLRFHYPKAIFHNVMQHALFFEKKAHDWIRGFSKKERQSFETTLLTQLKKGDEETKLLAFEFLLKLENTQFLPRLLNQFERLSVRGKLKVIDLLSESSYAKETIVIEKLGLWRKLISVPSVRNAIHQYYAKHQLMKKEMLIQDLDSEYLAIQAAAILTTRTSSVTLNHSLKALEKLNALLHSSLHEEVAMGLSILGLEKRKENIQDIFPFLKHPSILVARAAAKAISLCADPTYTVFTLDLIDYVGKASDPEVRIHCLKALDVLCDAWSAIALIRVSMNFRTSERKSVESIGKRANISDLLTLTKDEKLPIRARLIAGKILGKLSPLDLKIHQKNLIAQEIERAYFYLYHAEMLKNEERDHDIAILKDALITTFRSILDFVIQLGASSQTLYESEILSHSLQNKNRKIRAHAFETLEKTLDPELFILIRPLVDERKQKEREEVYIKKGIKPVTMVELLETLQRSPSIANQIVSLTLQAKFKLPNWEDALKKKLESGDEIFQHFAHELLCSH